MGSSGSTPPAPDPYVTAAAQAGANKEAVQENYKDAAISTYAPWGNTTYQRDANGVPIAQVTSLGPYEQQYYDTAGQLTNALAGKASQLANLIPTNQFNFDNIPGTVSGLNFGSLSGISNPNIQQSYDMSGLPSLPGVNDFSADRDATSKAVYNRQASLLDPQFSQSQRDLYQSLADRGIVEGSEGYNKELGNFQRNRDNTYSNLADQATLAGSQEQSRLFGLSSAARSQLLGERSDAATFGNQANSQLLALQQSLRNQGLSEEQANAQLQNYAHQQGVSDATALRTQPFNEASALIQGAPALQMPQAPSLPQFATPPTQIGDYINQNYQNQLGAQQAKQASKSNQTAGGAAAGTALIGLAAL